MIDERERIARMLETHGFDNFINESILKQSNKEFLLNDGKNRINIQLDFDYTNDYQLTIYAYAMSLYAHYLKYKTAEDVEEAIKNALNMSFKKVEATALKLGEIITTGF